MNAISRRRSCDFRVVRALRSAGHDVTAVVEIAPGAEEAAVLDIAVRERRVFVTEDRDFGQLVYAAGRPAAGVILLRFPSTARANLPSTILQAVAAHGQRLEERFVVLEPGRIRIGGTHGASMTDKTIIEIEQAIDEKTQWVVFEPNAPATWQRVVDDVSSYLTSVWRGGKLAGRTPEEAFFVRCDRTTMTDDDIANGRLICLVGVAPLRPAEFVIMRISQRTAQAYQ